MFGQTVFNSKYAIPFTFYNYERNKFTIINDSTGCYEYNMQNKKWEFRKLVFEIEESFSTFLREYYFLHEKGSKIFFVDRGCGYVYVLENDTIKRHDKSFHQRNQYFGNFFLHNGMPHIFGGYGLFTFKNIISYYNPNEREWFSYHVVGEAPSPRYYTHGLKMGSKFYMSGGSVKRGEFLKDCWAFNFNQLKWENQGMLTIPKPFSSNFEYFIDEPRVINEMQNQKYVPFGNKIYSIDYFQNKLIAFPSQSEEKIKKIIVENGLVLYVKLNHNYTDAQIIIERETDFFSKNYLSTPLYENQKKIEVSAFNYLFLFIAGLLTLLFVLVLFFIYKSKKNKLGLVTFNDSEKRLISYFCSQGENGIEIAHINDFVNSDNPSADTLKKRREALIRSLKIKISQDCNIIPEAVFLESKHFQDKRIKILILNSKALDRYLNLPLFE